MKKESLLILYSFFSTRIFLFSLGVFAFLFLPKFIWFASSGHGALIEPFFRWDSEWYSSIAENGYSYQPGGMSNVGYFPLYPLLIKLLGFLGTPLAGIIISNLAFLISLFFLNKLFQLDYSKKVSFLALLYLLVFPASMFFSIGYSESLFFLFSVTSFYCARRNKWGLSGILGFLAALTRSVGVLLFPALIAEYALQNKILSKWKINKPFRVLNKKIFPLFLIPLGTILFSLFLWIRFREPFAFIKAQQFLGDRHISFPFSSFLEIFYKPYPWVLLGLAFAIFGIIMLCLMIKKVRLSYLIYSFLMLLVPLSTNSLIATHRYVLVIFPIFLALAILTEKNKGAQNIIFWIFTLGLSAYMILFANGWLIT